MVGCYEYRGLGAGFSDSSSFLNQRGHLKSDLGPGYESVVKTPAPQALGPVSTDMLGGHGVRPGIPVSESGGQDEVA